MKPLAALMIVLVALLGWESLPDAADPTRMPSVPTPSTGTAPEESPRPVADWTNVVLARPLFAQDRRPRPGASNMPNRSGVPEALPRLAGTVRSNDTLMAIFVLAADPSANAAAASPATTGPATTSPATTGPIAAGPTPGDPAQTGSHPDATTSHAGAKPIVVGRDGIVAGWTVVDIMDSAVTLERDGRSVTLRLSYANRPAAAPVAAPEALVLLHDKRTNPFLQP